MKKVVLMAAVMAVSASVQAGMVQWQAYGIKDPGGNSTISSVNMMYAELYYISAAVDSSEGWESTYGSLGTLVKGGLIDDAYGMGEVYAAESGQLGFEVMNQTTAQSIRNASPPNQGYASFYMKLYYAPTGTAAPGNYTYAGVSHLYTLNLNNISAGDASLDMGDVNGNVQWAPAVPEPATMALFGLGGLALVIRRKFRKEA